MPADAAAPPARPPDAVLDAYGWHEAVFDPIEVGLINRTFRVEIAGAPRFVLQRLHPVFGPAVNLDIDAVTRHLRARGLDTPLVAPTREGALWVTHEGATWRALTFLAGRTVHQLPGPAAARAAGALLGRFHAAVDDLAYEFRHVRAGVHDTPRHLARLAAALEEHAAAPEAAPARPVADAILAHARALAPLPATRARVVHGDLKISNVLFDPSLTRAVALLDLDTLARNTMAVEMGDALRSWCNPAGEDAPEPVFSPELFAAALAGYAQGAPPGLLDADERASLVHGTETIALELAARFCTDALEDRYFGWDPARFASRRAHNVARARNQAALAAAIREARPALERAVQAAFAG